MSLPSRVSFRATFASALIAILALPAGCPTTPPGENTGVAGASAGGSSSGGGAADYNSSTAGGASTSGGAGSLSSGGSTSGGASGDLSGLQVFPADNPWNQDVSKLAVHPNSDGYLNFIGLDKGLHPDFGTVWEGAPIGIPYVVVSSDQAKVYLDFQYADESDVGPYPIPDNPPIEGGANSDGDRHVILVDPVHKMLYELFAAYPPGNDGLGLGASGWSAGSGAIFDLTSNALRPAAWTSADAAGLPIFPGLVRYDEVVEKGEITHAIRFTVRNTQRAYIPPATHYASSSTDPNTPPMGLRVRLNADFDISAFSPHVQVILRAMKKYGMFVADNGSDWYVSGAPDMRWDDDELHQLGQVHGRDFEVVYTGDVVTQ
jgi:hypothetical protein